MSSRGGTLRDVTQTTVYLTDLKNAAGMNEVYASYFPVEPPARATVEARLCDPQYLVEIVVVAARLA